MFDIAQLLNKMVVMDSWLAILEYKLSPYTKDAAVMHSGISTNQDTNFLSFYNFPHKQH